jgi:Ca2+-binding RTX toxin-like protein
VAYPFAQFDTRTQPASEGYVPSFLSKLPFARRSSKGTTGGYHKPPTNQHVLETLEPRVLLAADLSFGVATDLTLQFDSIASEYQLVDDLDAVISAVHTDVVDGVGGDGVIDIIGSDSDGDDTLGLDWASLLGSKNINFTGLGTDTLSVLSDSDMSLTDDQLTVNGLGHTIAGFDAAHLVGGEGDNTLDASGFSGNVTLEGAGGHDTLIGGSGDDVLMGGAGRDTLTGGGGTDSLIGGLGSDTIRGANKANAWRVSFGNQGNVDGVAFSEVENLIGGNSADIFSFDDGAGVTGTISGGEGLDVLDYSSRIVSVDINLGTGAATDTGGFEDIESFTGGSGSDTLAGADAVNTWNITGVNAGNVGGVSFAGLENLEGSALDDTFALSNGASIGTVVGGDGTDTVAGADGANTWTIAGLNEGSVSGAASATFTGVEVLEGGSGEDTLIASDSDNVWDITGADSGSLNGLLFAGMENLTGGAGDDLFRFATGGSISGLIDGAGGVNTLDYSSQATDVVVNLQTSTATGVAGGFSGISSVKGGTGADTLRGLDASNVWALSGLNAGSVGSTDFSDFENLEGGSVDDKFVVQLDGGVTGTLSGGLGLDELIGADKLNTWTVDAGDSGTLNALAFSNVESLVGGSNEDEFLFALGGFVSGHFTGGPGLDRVRGADQRNTWRLKGNNSGKLNDRDFSGIENIEGGSDADDFIIESLGSIDGTLAGGLGSNTLDYSETSAGVTIDLSAGTATGTGGISDIENIIGSAGNDTIIGALSAVLLDTGAGTDTLDFSAVTSSLNITVHANGTLSVTDGVDTVNNIAGAENVIGGSGTNTYTFENGASIAGTITGGSNLLDYSASTSG